MSIKSAALALAAALMLSGAALAHAPEKGKNGGQQTDAGNYHVEVVARGNTVDVFVTDHSEAAVSTKGFKGTAILVVKGKAQRIMLAPRGENVLTGTSPVEIAAPVRGAIQITNTDNDTVQAKF
jgi:uncharacterized protein (DUF2147 family)